MATGNGIAREKTVAGYSYTAAAYVDFAISPRQPMNWRETLKCPKSNLINRVRGCIHIMDLECAPYASDKIYIMEQKTSTYRYLKERYNGLVGSEYLGDNLIPGEIINGIRHEDATNLSFSDQSLSHILSFDVFEHIPAYLDAFRECYRALKPGGCLLWSVPMARRRHENKVRATLNDTAVSITYSNRSIMATQSRRREFCVFTTLVGRCCKMSATSVFQMFTQLYSGPRSSVI